MLNLSHLGYEYNYEDFSPTLLTEDHNSYGPDNKIKDQLNDVRVDVNILQYHRVKKFRS